MDTITISKTVEEIVNLKQIRTEIERLEYKISEYKKISDKEKIAEWNETNITFLQKEIDKKKAELKTFEELNEVQPKR